MTINPNSNQMPKLVNVLMFAFRISPDMSLVDILGSGFEHSNEEALAAWIQETLSKPDFQIAESVLPKLIDRLEDLLSKRGEK